MRTTKWSHLLGWATTLFVGCAPRAPVATEQRSHPQIVTHEKSATLSRGQRIAIQFNDEPATIEVIDGWGRPLITYHGKAVVADSIKSIVVLKTTEARARFADQTLDAAILIVLK